MLVLLSNLLTIKFVKTPFMDLGIPAGILTYPLTFLICDVVTEIFGDKNARKMVYIGLFTTILGQALITMTMYLPSVTEENHELFVNAFGLNGIVTVSSLLAYLSSQIMDITIFTQIKKLTGDSHLWLRNNVSTLMSQITDTVIVNFGVFYIGLNAGLKHTLFIIAFSYSYKAVMALLDTPFCYLAVYYSKNVLLSEEKKVHPVAQTA